MGRIASAFKRLGKISEAALIPYVQVGYPTLGVTRQLVPILVRQGADLIELGLLAGDPLALGPVETTLDRHITLADCLSVASESRRANEIPLLLSSYYDLIREWST